MRRRGERFTRIECERLQAELRTGLRDRVVPLMREALEAALRELDGLASLNLPSSTLIADHASLSLLLRDVRLHEREWWRRIEASLRRRAEAGSGGHAARSVAFAVVASPDAGRASPVDALEERFGQLLATIERRIAGLQAGAGCDGWTCNPLRPALLAGSLLHAFRANAVSSRVQALVLRHFCQVAAESLATIYRWCNSLLLECERARDAAGKAGRGAQRSPAVRSTAGLDEDLAPAAQDDPRRNELGALDALRSRLLPAFESAASPTGVRRLQRQELQTMLLLLRISGDAGGTGGADRSTPVAQVLRRRLRNAAVGIGLGGDGVAFSAWQEASIEAVGRLLDAILADAVLAPEAALVVSDMAPLLLWVALEEPNLFDDTGHPLLRLLAMLVRLWDGNSGSTPVEREMHRLADGIAERMLAHHQGDVEVARTLGDELEAGIEPMQQRADEAATRFWQALHGREQVHLACTAADRQLARVFASGPLPPALARFLSVHWRQRLVRAWLHEGGESTLFAETCSLGDMLLVLDQEASGRQLADRLLQVQPLLRECLAAIGLEGDAEFAERSLLVAEYANPDAPRAWRHVVPLAPGAAVPSASTASEEDGIAVGDRFVRRLGSGAAQALRLAWRSPLSGTCVLADAQGQSIETLDDADLRQALQDGWLRHRPADPVRAVLDRLASGTAESPTPG